VSISSCPADPYSYTFSYAKIPARRGRFGRRDEYENVYAYEYVRGGLTAVVDRRAFRADASPDDTGGALR